jgi:hypothetical protein
MSGLEGREFRPRPGAGIDTGGIVEIHFVHRSKSAFAQLPPKLPGQVVFLTHDTVVAWMLKTV